MLHGTAISLPLVEGDYDNTTGEYRTFEIDAKHNEFDGIALALASGPLHAHRPRRCSCFLVGHLRWS
jgi:hypothetical protein